MGRTLILREDHLGDLILTTPLIRALQKAGHQLTVIVKKGNIPVLEGNPHIDRIRALEDICPDFPEGWMKLVKWIRREKFDTIIIPHAKPKEMIFVATLSGAGNRILMHAGLLGRLTGNTCLRSKLFQRARHMTEVWMDIAVFLGAKETDPSPEIFINQDEIEWGKNKLRSKFPDSPAPIIGIHPGAAGNNTCNLPFEEYGKLIEQFLAGTNYSIVITGSRQEREEMMKWPSPILTSDRVWISAGELDLRQLASVIKVMNDFICSGTGPLHIANAIGAATFSPFCSRIGHDFPYWGNTNGKGKHVTIRTAFCKTAVRNCKFAGACTGKSLFQEFVKMLAESPDRR